MKGDELLKFESVQNWINSLNRSATSRGKAGLTKGAKRVRLGRLWEYTDDGKLSPDDFLEEAREDINKASQRLNKYFQDKQNKGMSWNSACSNISFLRGFYTHNDVFFPKSYGMPKRRVSKVSRRDTKTEIYDYDENNGEVVFKNGLIQQFVQNLNFRDQTIAICLLSTGVDTADLLKLKVDFVKDGKGNISNVKRFLWHDNREKNGTEFKVYFSEEATEFLKRYVEQERSNAENNSPLFAKDDGGRLESHGVGMNFRVSAKKMGFTKDRQASPFRPKRFRHLFRTACGIAEVDSGYIMAMMGHSSNISASYLEKSNGLFLREYIKVEPYLTVFGVNKHKVTEMTEEIVELKSEVGVLVEAGKIVQNKTSTLEEKNVELEKTVNHLQSEMSDLKERLKGATGIIHTLEPILDDFVEFANLPAFQEFKRKKMEEKEAKSRVEFERADKEFKSKVLKREIPSDAHRLDKD